jgi:hypothetical protein
MSVARIPFSHAEESVLTQLGGWMLFIAIVHFLGAAFAILGACLFLGVGAMGAGAASQLGGAEMGVAMMVGGFIVVVVGAILIAQGVLLIQARNGFQAVAQTDDSDQAYLSYGFRKLKMFFLIEVILGALGLLSNCGGLIMTAVSAL